jgi:hypothetical protein
LGLGGGEVVVLGFFVVVGFLLVEWFLEKLKFYEIL